MKWSTPRRGFTMIELLVVIVILGILMAALIPVVGKMVSAGDDSVSRNNLMRLGRATMAYRSDHENCYPSAGGTFHKFIWRDPSNPKTKQTRNGRAQGWVYFGHQCPRVSSEDKVGDGNGYAYGCGDPDDPTGSWVNEEGVCKCFNTTAGEDGGIGAQPAAWYGSKSGGNYSLAEVAIMNGALYPYLDRSLKPYVSPTFVERAAAKTKVSRSQIARGYAMNIVTGAAKDLYDTDRSGYNSAGAQSNYGAIFYGRKDLKPYVDSSTMSSQAVMPAKVVLFVELDVDNQDLATANSLAGDQVWDWDAGDESMGFIHEDNGAMYAHVCFADGHVEAIRDPSADSESPDTNKRIQLSKWYGSGGLNASAKKLD